MVRFVGLYFTVFRMGSILIPLEKKSKFSRFFIYSVIRIPGKNGVHRAKSSIQ